MYTLPLPRCVLGPFLHPNPGTVQLLGPTAGGYAEPRQWQEQQTSEYIVKVLR